MNSHFEKVVLLGSRGLNLTNGLLSVYLAYVVGVLCLLRGAEAYSSSMLIMWGLLAATASALFLGSFGFFKTLRTRGITQDAFVYLLAFPLPSLFIKYLMIFVFDYEVLRYRQILLFIPFVAFLCFIFSITLSAITRLLKGKVQIFCDLDPQNLEKLKRVLAETGLDYVFELSETLNKGVKIGVTSSQNFSSRDAAQKLMRLHIMGAEIFDVNQFISQISGRVFVDDLDFRSFMLSSAQRKPMMRFYREVKNMMEVVLASVMVVPLLPVYAITALLVKYSSTGPIFYSQERVGLNGQVFNIYKFRSMYTDAEKHGSQWARGAQDDRITPVGRVLRALHIDELPQMLNIIRGEMSFVGPRPERPEFYRSLRQEVPLFDLRLSVKPGVTGWAQIYAGYASSVDDSKIKLEHDLYYIQHMSPAMDVALVFQTAEYLLPFRNSRNPLAARAKVI